MQNTVAVSKHQLFVWSHTLFMEDVSHLVPVSGICIVFQLWSEQEGSLYGSPVVLEMGLHTAFTTVWTPTVCLAVRWGNNRPGSSEREIQNGERYHYPSVLFCNSQLWWLPLVPPACWNTPRLKIQLNVKQRKSCNSLLADFLFQIFNSEVVSQFAGISFPGKLLNCFCYPG